MLKAVIAASALLVSAVHAANCTSGTTLTNGTTFHMPTLLTFHTDVAVETHLGHPTPFRKLQPTFVAHAADVVVETHLDRPTPFRKLQPTFHARGVEAITISTVTTTSTVFATLTSTLAEHAYPTSSIIQNNKLDTMVLNSLNMAAQAPTTLVTLIAQPVVTVFISPEEAGFADGVNDSADPSDTTTHIRRPAEIAVRDTTTAPYYVTEYTTSFKAASTTTMVIDGMTPPARLTGTIWSTYGGEMRTATPVHPTHPPTMFLVETMHGGVQWLVATPTSIASNDTCVTPIGTDGDHPYTTSWIDISNFIATGSQTWTEWPITSNSTVTIKTAAATSGAASSFLSSALQPSHASKTTTSIGHVTDVGLGHGGAVTAPLHSQSGAGSLCVAEGLMIAIATAMGVCLGLILML